MLATHPRPDAGHPPAQSRKDLATTQPVRHVHVPAVPLRAHDRLPVTPKMNKASFNKPEAIEPLEPIIN